MQVMAGKHWNDVQAEAQNQVDNGTLVYRNVPPLASDGISYQLPYHHSFEGDFTPDADSTKLAIFSDDGCDVTIDGSKVWSAQNQGQALPDLNQSLHKISFTLIAGRSYHIRVDYSNTIYTGDLDIDGATLFAYGASKWDWSVDGWNPATSSSSTNTAELSSRAQPHSKMSASTSLSNASTSSDDGSTYLVAVNVEIQFSYDPNTGLVTQSGQPRVEATPIAPTTSNSQLRAFASPQQSSGNDGGADPTEYQQHYYLAFTKDFLKELGKDYASGAARNRIGYTFKGMGLAVVDTAKGTVRMISHPGETATGISTAIKNPKRVIAALNKAGQEYIKSASTDPNAFALNTGKIAGEIALSVAGTKGLDKLSKAAKVALIAKVTRTGTVWDLVEPVLPLRTGSLVPQAFKIAAGQKLFYVNTNGTKHIFEYVTRSGIASIPQQMIDTQSVLSSFRSALQAVSERGYQYDKIILIDRWELKIGAPRQSGLLPVVYHAVYK